MTRCLCTCSWSCLRTCRTTVQVTEGCPRWYRNHPRAAPMVQGDCVPLLSSGGGPDPGQGGGSARKGPSVLRLDERPTTCKPGSDAAVCGGQQQCGTIPTCMRDSSVCVPEEYRSTDAGTVAPGASGSHTSSSHTLSRPCMTPSCCPCSTHQIGCVC